jgi:acetolactate synthase-1/2/3 large subunit
MSRPPETGAEALVRALERLGVRHVFGVPGTQNVALFEALRGARLRTIVPTHELAAAFMAGAYYRVSGQPGVLVSIPGPGFAYTLAGLAEARLDSAALVHITGAPPRGPGNQFRLQELKQAAIAGPMVKGLVVVERPEDVDEAVVRAHAAALAGEPGPVMIKLAESAWGPVSERPGRFPDEHTFARAEPAGDPEPVLARLRAARRPVVLAGQGAQGAAEALRTLAETWGAPVVTTGSGRGVIPEDHPLAMGYDNARGAVEGLNELLAAADLVLVLGAKLGHNGSAGFRLRLPAERTVQVDAAPEVLGANYPVAASAVSSVEAFLGRLSGEHLAGGGWTATELASWKSRLSAGPSQPEPRMAGRPAVEFFRELRAVLPRETLLVTDSGLHQVLARRHYDVLAPRGLLAPSDFQAMGFGLPAAIAARLGAPERPVVALVGDGGFAMSGMELATAVRESVDLVAVVCRDGYLGQIRLQQLGDYGRTHGVEVGDLDYEAMAAALGVRYARLEDDVGGPVRGALRGGVWVLDVPVGDSPRILARRIAGAGRRVTRGAVPGWVRSLLKAILRNLLPRKRIER